MAGHVHARPWIDALSARLPKQAQVLDRLLTALEADERFSSLELQCSVARGSGDELSDLDVGIGIADDSWDEAVADLPGVFHSLAPTLDILATTLAGQPYFFVQYADGMQVDAVARRDTQIRGRVPDAIVLLDRKDVFAHPFEPPSLRADDGKLRDWSYAAWIALGNVAKYAQRGSLWEGRHVLEEARTNLLRLHASALDVAYPEFGLTSILDDPSASLPEGLEATVADLDRDALIAAALACADLLEPHHPPPLSAWVRERLDEARLS